MKCSVKASKRIGLSSIEKNHFLSHIWTDSKIEQLLRQIKTLINLYFSFLIIVIVLPSYLNGSAGTHKPFPQAAAEQKGSAAESWWMMPVR